ncbi:importin-11-like [Gossypium australe]|uniref:Importin-11-like n=1 Tax=Gossypium australe TaxID=47621 RepID=A0A5B6V3N4_9ROSI|nr:importin-11-like [Gossypium australe]
MALSAADLPALYTLLVNSMSQDESVRKPAEAALSQSENRPGFCSCLMEVITAKDLVSQVDIRLMASVYFKNSINRYWRKRRDSSGISSEEKQHLKQKLLSHLREENNQIAQMLAVLISKIARFDYPREWPELFSFLAQQLQSADVLTSHRIFMILFRTLKELSTKRLTADQRTFAEISSHLFEFCWRLWQSDIQTILHGFSTVSQSYGSSAVEQHHDDLYLTCERWLFCLKIICQLVISGFQSDAKCIQEIRPVKEVSPVLLNATQSFLPYYTSFQSRHPKFWDFIKKACTKLMKVLVAIQQRHPYSFGDTCVLQPVLNFCLNKITDPEPDVLSFAQFLIKCMVMVKSVLECKEYKPSLTGRVMDENSVTLEQMKKNNSNAVAGVLTSLLPKDRIVLLCNVLIRRYFVLNSSDLEEWYENSEAFHHEQDMVQWTEKLRPCAEALYIVLFENHSQLLAPIVVSILQEAMNGCPTSVTEITPGLLLKDAAYGAAAYVYYELSNYLSFKDWFDGALSLELSNDHPNMRIIHRKVALILGQWVSEIKNDTKRPVYCALIRLLQDKDLSVRLAACRSLCLHVEDASFSEKDFSDLLPVCWVSCFNLVKEVQEFDSKVILLFFVVVHYLLRHFFSFIVFRKKTNVSYQIVENFWNLYSELWNFFNACMISEEKVLNVTCKFCIFLTFNFTCCCFSPKFQVQVLNLISVLLGHVNEVIPYANNLMQFFQMIQLLIALRNFVVALGYQSPSCYAMLLPILQKGIDINGPDELNLLEDSMLLWEATISHAPTMVPQLLAYFPCLVEILERNFDQLQVAVDITEGYIILGGREFLSMHASGVARLLDLIVGNVNDRGLLSTLPVIDILIQCFPTEVPSLISSTLQKLVVICLCGGDDKDPSKTAVKASSAAILARIWVMNTNYLAQLTSESSLSSLLQQTGVAIEDNILLCLVDIWLDKVDNVSSHQKKTFGLALSIILTLRLPQVLDKLDQILSVCTSVILGGTDDLSEEVSSGDTMSSSRIHGEDSLPSKELRRRQIKLSDPINQLSLENSVRENLQTCSALHGESFNSAMARMHPAAFAQLKQALKMP